MFDDLYQETFADDRFSTLSIKKSLLQLGHIVFLPTEEKKPFRKINDPFNSFYSYSNNSNFIKINWNHFYEAFLKEYRLNFCYYY